MISKAERGKRYNSNPTANRHSQTNTHFFIAVHSN
jgi:hypothetical protein